ncbi:MAG: DMT family transporter [Proteobacteria bacterium]|nr:DMT family transporter [Pseudomonadota bacterium]
MTAVPAHPLIVALWRRMEQAPVASGVALTAVGAIAFGMLPLVLGALYDDGVSPESALLYRYLGSLPPLLLWLLWRRAPRDGLLLSLAAGVAIGTGTIFLFRGYAALPASLTVLIFYTYPAFTLIVGLVFFGVRLEARTTLAIAMVLGAAALIVGPGSMEGDIPLAVLVTFGAPLGYAFYLSCLSRLPVGTSVPLRLLGVNLGACLPVVPLMLLEGGSFTLPHSATGWLAGLHLPVVTGIAATALIVLGASLAGGARAAVAGASELMTALAIGWLLFGEAAHWASLAGAGLILLAIVVSATGRKAPGRRGVPPAPPGTSPR